MDLRVEQVGAQWWVYRGQEMVEGPFKTNSQAWTRAERLEGLRRPKTGVVNRFDGACVRCGMWVAPGAGRLRLINKDCALYCAAECEEKQRTWKRRESKNQRMKRHLDRSRRIRKRVNSLWAKPDGKGGWADADN